MRGHLPPHIRVKAAGGVRTLDALLEVRSIGVARAGATQTAKMLDECKKRLGLSESPLATQTAGNGQEPCVQALELARSPILFPAACDSR